MSTRRIISWAGVDETCEFCDQPARHRWRNEGGTIVGAACARHRPAALLRFERPPIDHETLNRVRFSPAELARVEADRPADGIPVPTRTGFELARYRMPNGSSHVTLADDRQATWEAYCEAERQASGSVVSAGRMGCGLLSLAVFGAVLDSCV